ncbi:MAG: PKD domain-containing protein, partial [Chitinophagaceae bacterium]
ADTGYFDIKLTAINNGCREIETKLRYVYIQPSVSRFIWRTDCNDYRKILFTNKSLGAQTSVWDFGDGSAPYTGTTPPPHTYGADGIYQVKLTTTNGSCTYTLTKQIKVTDPTPRIFSDDAAGCRPFNASFRTESNNPGVFRKYQWNFGDGSPVDTAQGASASHLYTTPGSYDVKVVAIDTAGCRYEVTATNLVTVSGPIARFGAIAPRGCAGMTVEFIDSSRTDGTNGIRNWIFEFGDSTRVTFNAPPFTHTYDSVGDYDVKMMVIDSAGCRDSLTIRGFVRTSTIKAGFTALQEYCPRSPLYFPNLTESDLPFTSLWEFGDGQRSIDYNARNSYRDTGFYTVKLTVTDLLGCKDSIIRDTFVHIKNPTADFNANTFTTYCTPFQALFTNTSDFYYGSKWSFGPGQGSSEQQHPYSYYTQPGVYPVKLVITAHGGCKDSVTKTITVRDQSDARLDYSPLSGCTPLNVSFNAFAPLDSARFVWDFGDGNVTDTTLNSLVHRYTDFGDFRPKIIMKEATGNCVITLVGSKVISLLGAHAKFTLDTMQFCDGGLITTNSDSTTSNDPIVQYSWSFGNGGNYSSAAPTHNYTQPGTYEIVMAVRTQAGCTDTMRKGPVRVFASPRIAIQADTSLCRDDRITYGGLALNSDTATWSWNWTFPNGTSSNLQTPPQQVYRTPGNYQVQLSVVSPLSGCSDSATQNISVHDLPVVTLPESLSKFVGVPAILPAQYSSGVRTYNWSPANDLSCANCPQPVATPKFNTRYTVTATDSNSCRSTASVQVLVLCQGAKVFVPNTFSPNGDGVNDQFGIQGSGMARVKSLRVFNRWGEVVFERRDFPVNDGTAGWDGTYKGKKAAPDVYIYQLEVYCENSDVIRMEGNVALIR